MKRIEITVAPSGKVNLETSGFSGSSCKEASKPVKTALFGSKPTREEVKPEFYYPESQIRETE